MEIVIRELHSNAEFLDAIELQKTVWRLKDYGDCIPNHVFIAVVEAGGLALGAYAGSEMIGFLLVIAAYSEAHGLYHHSHILGVHPGHMFRNVGFLLKKAHYERARDRGIRLVIWTFDPLLGANARLNIAKLGAVVREYRIDYYGEVMGESELVSGIPSDRFRAEWHVQSERVEQSISGEAAGAYDVNAIPQVNRVDTVGGRPVMTGFDGELNDPKIRFEIPGDFQAIYDSDRDAALRWRMQSRDAFLILFNTGYAATGFMRIPARDGHRNFYILERDVFI